MGSAIYKDGSTIKRASLFYNDGGVIKDINNFTFWVKNGDQFFKIPKQENLLLNLDALSFSCNTIQDASTNITKQFTLSQAGTPLNDLGDMVEVVDTQGGYQVDVLNKEWYIPRKPRTRIHLQENMLNSGNLTIAITLKFEGTPASGRSLIWFSNSTGLRLEWNGSQIILSGEASLSVPTSAVFPALTNYNNYFQIVFMIMGKRVIGFQDGVLCFVLDLASEPSKTNGDFLQIFSQRGGSTNSDFGCPVSIKHFQIWNNILQMDEVDILRKYLFLD